MKAQVLSNIDEVSANEWNDLIPDNDPFCRHEFLSALERNGCVGKRFGWVPRHIALTDSGRLIGAVILYEKYNNYGEFVFDHAWHDAYNRCGMQYYPKMVSAIPYTPANGARLLSLDSQTDAVYPALLGAIKDTCKSIGASSFHCLFASNSETKWLESQNLYLRHDCQFHWHNQNYSSFDDFLQALKSKKRKNIKRERKSIADSGVTLRKLDGHSASHEDWEHFNNFYHHTFLQKSGTPTMNLDFFKEIASKIPDQIVLILAEFEDNCIAGSLMFSSDTKLYGRHWGCTEHVDNLHFEACYYMGVEHCIENKLKVFEPGAQGEHKLARGFIPTITESAHLIIGTTLKNAIKGYCEQESEYIESYINDLQSHSPYRVSM
jgi:predicted N-acyltransferase